MNKNASTKNASTVDGPPHPGRTPMSAVNFKDLETRGFVHIPGFLSPAELREYADDFRAQGFDANGNYRVTTASPTANARASQRVQEVLRLVAQKTNLRVDAPQAACYFATGKKDGINFPWHQDHESFFQLQNHYDYLNFYIPVMKSRPDKSNLSIIPFDVLERDSPKTFRKLVRSGATHFVLVRNTRLAYSDDSGDIHMVRGDLDRMAHTPMLSAGDLLLLRGDVIHKTQDSETERIAMSFRVSCSQTLVKRSRLAYGGLGKARMMVKNPEPYQRMFLAFDAAGRDEVPVQELNKLMETITVTPPASRWEFFKYLLQEKRRAGVLGHFVGSSLRTVVWAVGRRIVTMKGPVH